jgi:hypothetical protein
MQRVLVVGAGEVGVAVAKRARNSHEEVHILCRRRESATTAAIECGLGPDQVWFADLTDLSATPRSLSGVETVKRDCDEIPLMSLVRALSPCDVVDSTNVATSLADKWVIGQKVDSPTGPAYEASVHYLRQHASALHNLIASHAISRYVRLSTTGLGRWGIDLPFTHGDRGTHGLMSNALWFKTALAGIEHQLLWALGRSFGSRIGLVVPAAFVGFENDASLATLALSSPTIAAGEDRVYTAEELAVISSDWQMGSVTRDEVAQCVLDVLSGADASFDLIAALRKGSMSGSADGALARLEILRHMRRVRSSAVANGALGGRVTLALVLLRIIRVAWPGTIPEVLNSSAPTGDISVCLAHESEHLGVMLSAVHGESRPCACSTCLSRLRESLRQSIDEVMNDESLSSIRRHSLIQLMNTTDWYEGDLLAVLWRRPNKYPAPPRWMWGEI